MEYILDSLAIVSVIIIIIGTLVMIAKFVISPFTKEKLSSPRLNHMRLNFGSYLLLSLECLIARDVLISISDPFRELQDLAILGALVLVRVALGFFLNKELKMLK